LPEEATIAHGFRFSASQVPSVMSESASRSTVAVPPDRVVVPDIAAYEAFYKRLIQRVDLTDVRSIFVMEELKSTTALPLDYAV
jgi:hypothetical protein